MERKYQCECCKDMKFESEFYEDKKRTFGLKLDACKQCKHEKYLIHKEKRIKYQMKYIYENYDKYMKYQREYRRKNVI